MDSTIIAESSAGAFVLFDPACEFQPDDAWVEALNIVLDPEGETDLSFDYPGRAWPEVWREAVSALRSAHTCGAFILLQCGEGTFSLRLQDQPLSATFETRQAALFEEHLCVPSGTLRLVEAMAFFDGTPDPLSTGVREIEVPAGEYLARIHQLSLETYDSPAVGIYGTLEQPAVILELAAPGTTPANVSGKPFPRLRFQNDSSRFPGALCDGEVTRIEEGRASLRLKLTHDTWAGYARMPLPEKSDVRAGQRLRVRLVEDRRNYWLVEWTGQLWR